MDERQEGTYKKVIDSVKKFLRGSQATSSMQTIFRVEEPLIEQTINPEPPMPIQIKEQSVQDSRPEVIEEDLTLSEEELKAKYTNNAGSINLSGLWEAYRKRDKAKREREFKPYKLDEHPKDIEVIKNHSTEAQEENGTFYDSFAKEMIGHVGINTGNYSDDLIYSLYGKDQESEVGMKPVNLAEEVKNFCQTLLDKGEQQVIVVDFGAGQATTLCAAAKMMEDLIHQGRVKFIATNGYSEPRDSDLAELVFRNNQKDRFGANLNYDLLIYAIAHKTVDYKKADILELYELVKGKKIHLMFMSHIWENFNVGEISDLVLKIASEMLHPDYGTAIVAHSHAPTTIETKRGYTSQLVDEGLDHLEFSGFHENKHRDRFRNRILVYQATNAPFFNLAKPR